MSKLTPREQQVCEALKKKPDLTYQGIGQSLTPRLTGHGVNFHLRNIYKKVGTNKTGLVANLNQLGGSS